MSTDKAIAQIVRAGWELRIGHEACLRDSSMGLRAKRGETEYGIGLDINAAAAGGLGTSLQSFAREHATPEPATHE